MLSIENFRKRYDDFELDCTMSVEPGQITGIVGANGAGKSTLFKAILGLVKGDSGRITLFGKEPQQLTREDKEKIGVAFTNAGFNEYLRIKDIVPVLSNVYPSFEKEKFLGSCKKLNLSLDKKLKEFSTGMKAKLNVLCAAHTSKARWTSSSGSGRKSPTTSTTFPPTSGTPGPTKPAPSARPTAISSA